MAKSKSSSKTKTNSLTDKSPSELKALAHNLPRPRYGGVSSEATDLLVHAANIQDVDLFILVAKTHLKNMMYLDGDGLLAQRLQSSAPKWLLWLVNDAKTHEEVSKYIWMARGSYDVDWTSVVSSGKLASDHLAFIFYTSLLQGKPLCSLDVLLDATKGSIDTIPSYLLPPNSSMSMRLSLGYGSNFMDERGYKMSNHLPTGKLKSCDLSPLLKAEMYMTAFSLYQHLCLSDADVTNNNKIAPRCWINVASSLNKCAKIVGKKDLPEFKKFLLKFLNTRKTDYNKKTSLHMATSLSSWPEEDALSFVMDILNNKPILAYQQDRNGQRIIDERANPLVRHVVAYVEKRGMNNALKHQVKKRKKKISQRENKNTDNASIVSPPRKRRM